MRAFSYAWSLPVTWQRQRSHHSICHSRKTHHVHKPHGSIFYRTGAMWESTFYIAGIGIFDFFAPVTLTLTRWHSYTNLTRIPWRYTTCAHMNFLRQSFPKLSSKRHTHLHTDRQTDANEIIHHAASQVVNKLIYLMIHSFIHYLIIYLLRSSGDMVLTDRPSCSVQGDRSTRSLQSVVTSDSKISHIFNIHQSTRNTLPTRDNMQVNTDHSTSSSTLSEAANRQTNRQTDERQAKHYLLGRGNYVWKSHKLDILPSK